MKEPLTKDQYTELACLLRVYYESRGEPVNQGLAAFLAHNLANYDPEKFDFGAWQQALEGTDV